MNLKKPNAALVADKDGLTQQLVDYYQALVELDKARPPSKSPALKAITADLFATMRQYVGDIDGEAGPRAVIVTGGKKLQDGKEGVFAWDPTSTLADNGSTVINPSGASPGRWRKLVLGATSFSGLSGTATQSQLPDVVVGVQTFTAGGTYTASAGTRSQIVELWGGGGGGSGAVSGTTGTACAFGLGGGAGAYTRRRYAIPAGATGTVVIGAAGTAGANTGAIAGAGGVSTFTDGTTLLTAPGGTAGPASAAAAATLLIQAGAARSAKATNGDVNGIGDQGGFGLRLSATGAMSGRGGATSLGGAGQELIGTTTGGAAAANSGSGGSGGVSATTGTPVTGGAGGSGFCVITEYA